MSVLVHPGQEVPVNHLLVSLGFIIYMESMIFPNPKYHLLNEP